MLIGICDDSKMIREYVYMVCQRVLVDYDENIKIKMYADGNGILIDEPDILILDIELPVVSGLQIKEELQKEKKSTIIIFVTCHDEMMPMAFGVNVLGFITKTDIGKELPMMLKKAVEMCENFIILNGIDSRNIMYVKASHIYCELYMDDGKMVLVRDSCKNMERKLAKNGFVRLSRFCLVNMSYINEIKESITILTDNTQLLVSTRNRVKVKKQYVEYCYRKSLDKKCL